MPISPAHPCVSVVIPSYNAEKTLTKCVQSLLDQTYPHLEILIVFDCSPDGTLALAQKLAAGDSRIRVLENPQNLGLSQTRNHGIAEAQGKYLLFLDSDDYLDTDLISALVEEMEQGQDVVIFGMDEEYYDAKDQLAYHNYVGYTEKVRLEGKALYNEVVKLEEKTMYGYSTNKLYRADIVRDQNIRFQQIVLIEDILFNIDYFYHVTRGTVLPGYPYHYVKKQNQSLTNKFVPDYYKVHVERITQLYQQIRHWDVADDHNLDILARLYIRYLLSGLARNCDPRAQMKHKDRKDWLHRVYASEIFLTLVPAAHPQNFLVKILAGLLRRRRTGLVLAAARVVYWVKAKLPILFSKLRYNK